MARRRPRTGAENNPRRREGGSGGGRHLQVRGREAVCLGHGHDLVEAEARAVQRLHREDYPGGQGKRPSGSGGQGKRREARGLGFNGSQK